MTCKHCRNGFLENKFGQDVECVNGVLIDIDEAHEGWQRDVAYPVAPCHPMWDRQQSGDEDFPNDCQERLNSWSEEGANDVADERDGEIKRVIALLQTDTGPSRDLDWEVAEALGGSVRLVSGLGLNGRTKGRNRLFWPHTTTRNGHAIPYYTKDRAKAVAKLRAALNPTPAARSE